MCPLICNSDLSLFGGDLLLLQQNHLKSLLKPTARPEPGDSDRPGGGRALTRISNKLPGEWAGEPT